MNDALREEEEIQADIEKRQKAEHDKETTTNERRFRLPIVLVGLGRRCWIVRLDGRRCGRRYRLLGRGAADGVVPKHPANPARHPLLA